MTAVQRINGIRVESGTIIGNNYNIQTVVSAFREIRKPTISEKNAALDKLTEIKAANEQAYYAEIDKAQRQSERAFDSGSKKDYDDAKANVEAIKKLFSQVDGFWKDKRAEIDRIYDNNK